MTITAITDLRLSNLGLAQPTSGSPVEVVRQFVAVQSQDYLAAKWAVGQRMQQGVTDADVEQSFNAGAILRTHVLRPTWHFVTPDDIAWMLALTAPRVKLKMATYNRSFGLDEAVFARANAALEKALQGGSQRTRAELVACLVEAGVFAAGDDSSLFNFAMMNAELDGLICSGALRGKQHTYALLAERAPHARTLTRDEALAELTRRYFVTRGPATIKDFVWWSGLTVADVKAGLALNAPALVEEPGADGQAYWLDPSALPATPESSPTVRLLPNYDEYTVSYADRSAIYDPAVVQQVDARGNFLFNNTIIIDGQVLGVWRRTLRKAGVEVTPQLFRPLNEIEQRALHAEMQRYAQFLRLGLIDGA